MWTLGAGDVLDSFMDIYTQKTKSSVLGPQPLMGAGVALDFSCKPRAGSRLVPQPD